MNVTLKGLYKLLSGDSLRLSSTCWVATLSDFFQSVESNFESYPEGNLQSYSQTPALKIVPLYSAEETYNIIDPTYRSHRTVTFWDYFQPVE